MEGIDKFKKDFSRWLVENHRTTAKGMNMVETVHEFFKFKQTEFREPLLDYLDEWEFNEPSPKITNRIDKIRGLLEQT